MAFFATVLPEPTKAGGACSPCRREKLVGAWTRLGSGSSSCRGVRRCSRVEAIPCSVEGLLELERVSAGLPRPSLDGSGLPLSSFGTYEPVRRFLDVSRHYEPVLREPWRRTADDQRRLARQVFVDMSRWLHETMLRCVSAFVLNSSYHAYLDPFTSMSHIYVVYM